MQYACATVSGTHVVPGLRNTNALQLLVQQTIRPGKTRQGHMNTELRTATVPPCWRYITPVQESNRTSHRSGTGKPSCMAPVQARKEERHQGSKATNWHAHREAVYVCVCVCVCDRKKKRARERKGERAKGRESGDSDRERQRQRKTATEKERGN